MPELTATIEGVFNDGKRTDIKAGGKKLVTWKEDLNRLARSLEGQECVIKYTVQQKGEYTNYLFDGAEPVKQAPEPEPPAWTNPGDQYQERRTDIRWQAAFNNAKDFLIAETGGKNVDLEGVFALADVIYVGMTKRQDGGA